MRRQFVKYTDDELALMHTRHMGNETLETIADSVGVSRETLGKQLRVYREKNNLRGPGMSPLRITIVPAQVERLKKKSAPLGSFLAAIDARKCLWMGGGMGWEPACGCDRMSGSSYCALHERESRRKVDEV